MITTHRSYFLIMFVSGFIFLRSGIEKIVSGIFPQSMPEVLLRFASRNPYPSVRIALLDTVYPNAITVSNIIMYAEVLAGACMMVTAVYFLLTKRFSRLVLLLFIFGITIGALLNDAYWIVSGWTNPAVESLNMLMLFIFLTGFYFVYAEALPSITRSRKKK